MVPDDDYTSSFEYSIFYRFQIVLRGLYDRYSLGKNASGRNYPTDGSGADSHYGGRSIWGQIDALAVRYHWTMEYILWEISWANAQLMIADALKIDYKSKSESSQQNDKQTRIPDIIDLDDPDSMNTLLLMAGGKR